MEGGGDGRDTKVSLRQGMEVFLASLKQTVISAGWRWRLIPCGGREQTYRRFHDAWSDGNATIVVLLVDAERPVREEARRHLISYDRWDLPSDTADIVHLMVQTMETWIVADREALADYYGQGFHAQALPRAENLEGVEKTRIATALSRATRTTRKGEYHKIRHGGALLARIRPGVVRERCPGCDRLFVEIGRLILPAVP
jgi:hypothetical protein